MKSPELEHFQEIFEFFGKTSPYKKIFKIMFRKFTSRHQSMLLCAKFVKIVRQEIGEIVHYSCDQKKRTKFRLPLKLLLLRGSRPKSAMASPNIWVTTFQISPKLVHFWRSYSRPREGHQNAP